MKKQLKTMLSVLLILAYSLPIYADPTSSTNRSIVQINPDTLRTYLLNNNTSVLTSLNQVEQAKEEVNVARGQLLPSLNIGTILSSGVGFILNSVSILLPFLLPSNWFNLDASQNQLMADRISFYLVELNTYASAYSLYNTIIGDIELKSVLQQQADNLKQIQKIVTDQVFMGLATQVDLDQVSAQAELAQIQVYQIDELLVQEKSTIRKMLALPLNSTIEFTAEHLATIPEENSHPQALLDQVFKNSPEALQISSLIEAAKDSTWSKIFGFLTGNSLSYKGGTNNGNPTSVAFNSAQVNGSIGIGFAYAPAIRLSQLNVAQLKIRQNEIKLEEARTLESTLGSLASSQLQLNLATSAEVSLNRAYQAILLNYKAGLTDLLHLLDAANNITSASAGRLKAQIDLDNQRVSLNRILISGAFTKIKNCQTAEPRRLKDAALTLDQLCTGQSPQKSAQERDSNVNPPFSPIPGH